MAAEEVLLAAEHMHRAALALGIACGAARQLGHDAFRVHARGQHMAVITIGRNDIVARLQCSLQAHDHGFLPDIEVAEAADQAHAIELPRLLLEAADQQHVRIEFLLKRGFVLADLAGFVRLGCLCFGHSR